MKITELTKRQRADVERLTTPRPFETDFKKHQARLRQDAKAAARLRRAGIDFREVER